MSFLTPLFLLGGIAVALPIVFHLVRRSSREKMVFSSLMFLKPTPPRMTRRNRLEHIFLLLLRCLAICILSLGFARPFLQKPMPPAAPSGSGTRMVLLVDTSASMKREGVWPAALARAQDVLRQTSPADQVAILTFDDQVRSIVSFEQWAAMDAGQRGSLGGQRLAESKPTWRATHLGNALIAAAETLEDADKREQHAGPKRIVVVTDSQEGSKLDGLQGYEWPRGVEVAVETIKAKRPTNAGLQWVMDAEDSGRAASDTLRLRVSNSADAKGEQFQIRWSGVTDSTSVDAYVPPGQSRIVAAPKLASGKPAEQIVLTGDDESFDNAAYHVTARAQEINVLFVGADADQDPAQLFYYLKRAFQDTRRQAVRLHRLADGVPSNASAPGSNQLIIVANAVPENRRAEIAQFIQRGGTVLLTMNDTAAAKTLAELSGLPDLNASEAPVANYAMFGQMDFEHPLLAPFSDPRFSDFTKIRVWKHRKLNLDALTRPSATLSRPTGEGLGVRVIARFDDGDPAIAEIPVGRGRVFVFTTSWRPADSQLALSSKFVPLLYSVLEQAGGMKSGLAQFRVGDTVELSALGIQASSAAMTIRKPDGSQVQANSGETRFSDTDQPGIYEIVNAQPPVRFAVNLDPAESRTAPLPIEELARLAVPVKAREIALAKPAERSAQLHKAELESRQKLWRWLIVGALVVLIVETWVAGRITRRAVVPAESPT
jgi:hypothetical protein